MTRFDPSRSPRGDLRGAWWILVVVVVFFAAVAINQVSQVIASRSEPRVGDGQDPSTYGYDLSELAVDTRWLAAAMPKDNLQPLTRPSLLTAAEVDSLNGAERGKYLVSEDRVVGVVIDGVARAYPLRVLDWHEVVNDTIAGVPVLVAWHPLSGVATAFERRLDGQTLELAVSGLVWNSHHVLHDQGVGDAESLWVPLLGRAISGPWRDRELPRLRCALVTWHEWLTAYPQSQVPRPASQMKPAYKRDPYGNYASGDVVRYPVTKLPPLPDDQRLKDQLAVDRAERDGIMFAAVHGYRFALQAVGLLDAP